MRRMVVIVGVCLVVAVVRGSGQGGDPVDASQTTTGSAYATPAGEDVMGGREMGGWGHSTGLKLRGGEGWGDERGRDGTADGDGVGVETGVELGVMVPHDAILLPSPRYPLLIVPYAGPDYTIHRGSFRLEEDGILCCEFTEGVGLGWTAGVRMFLPLGGAWYISPRLGYTRHTGEFSATSEPFPFRGLGDSVELMRFDEELTTPLPTVAADLFWLVRIDSALGLYVGGGPSFEYLPEARFSKIESINGPDGLTFLDGTTSRTQEVDFETAAAEAVLSARFGLAMLYPVTETIYLNPEINVSLPVSVVTDNWRMFAIQATLGIGFSI